MSFIDFQTEPSVSAGEMLLEMILKATILVLEFYLEMPPMEREIPF